MQKTLTHEGPLIAIMMNENIAKCLSDPHRLKILDFLYNEIMIESLLNELTFAESNSFKFISIKFILLPEFFNEISSSKIK